MMDRWPVLMINLGRSHDRMNLVRDMFHNEDFIRIEGVDGKMWESGVVDKHGRPKFNTSAVSHLTDEGIIGFGATERYPLLPCEVGCAMGHRRAWEYVIQNELEFAIICEDDIAPTKKYRASFQFSIDRDGGMPLDADVMFLTGEDSPEWTMRCDDAGRLKLGYCNYAYVITKRGAQRAIDAQFPMYLPCDIQWWSCAFKGYEVFSFVPKLEEQGYAYAMKEALVRRNAMSYTTLMTPSGRKPWLSRDLEKEYEYGNG